MAIAERCNSQKAGVWETDAPVGYVGLAVFDSIGQMVLRIEVLKSEYSSALVPPLEEWLRDHDPSRLRVVR